MEGAAKIQHSDKFTKATKDNLIKEWETNTWQKRPTYEYINPITNSVEIKIINSTYYTSRSRGPHKWWNGHPLKVGAQHQGGIHGKGAPLNEILKDVKK